MKVLNKMILGTLSATLALSLVSAAASAGQCTNERWNKVMKRGKIVIGVKADYKPWGIAIPPVDWWVWKLTWPRMSPTQWA